MKIQIKRVDYSRSSLSVKRQCRFTPLQYEMIRKSNNLMSIMGRGTLLMSCLMLCYNLLQLENETKISRDEVNDVHANMDNDNMSRAAR